MQDECMNCDMLPVERTLIKIGHFPKKKPVGGRGLADGVPGLLEISTMQVISSKMFLKSWHQQCTQIE